MDIVAARRAYGLPVNIQVKEYRIAVDFGAGLVGGIAGRNLGISNAVSVARAGSSASSAVRRGDAVVAAASGLITSGYTGLANRNP